MSDKYKAWLQALEAEEINWNAAGIPVDKWSGEPLGIGYKCRNARIKIAQWARFAYKKPRVVQTYEAWADWCLAHRRWHIGTVMV